MHYEQKLGVIGTATVVVTAVSYFIKLLGTAFSEMASAKAELAAATTAQERAVLTAKIQGIQERIDDLQRKIAAEETKQKTAKYATYIAIGAAALLGFILIKK